MTDFFVSTVPGAIDALTLVASTAINNPDVPVSDGPTATQPTRRGVHIGYAEVSLGAPAIEWKQAITGLSVANGRETYDIVCRAESSAGNGPVKPLRDEVFGWLDAIHNALAADKTMGRVVQSAALSLGGYLPNYVQGPGVAVLFHVHIEAQRRRT